MASYKADKKLFLLFFTLLLFSIGQAKADEQQTQITLRTIGHEFLLQLNDSTSRVLPIKKIDDRYAVQFERAFSFEPELLSLTVFKVMQANKISDRYIVEVVKCDSNEVIHSFEASLTVDENFIACKLRRLPEHCYVFYFTVLSPTQETSQIKMAKTEKPNYIYLLLPLLLGGGVVLYLMKRKGKQALKAELISIGQFQFDQKRMILSLKAQSIELSTKESDLLLLLFSNENKTLERAYILNHIWGDEGDYVGRTLDVFISKLRKKLEADPALKIVNVRGVGYRFVVG